MKDLIINEQIKSSEVRLIDASGEQLGIKNLNEAKSMAESEGLDLVVISPNANPPVCKIMDYGKYKFETEKKEKEFKKNQKIIELKEVQLSMTIDTHDIETKAKHANKFLLAGNKVKISLRMKGRQQAYSANAISVVNNFFLKISDNGVIDKQPEVVGRNVIAIVSPKITK